MERLREILATKLLTLSGMPVTLGSLVTCSLVVLVAFVLARLAKKAVIRTITRRGHSRGAAASAGKIVWYFVVFIGLFVALDTLGFNLTAVLAGSAVLAVGIGFGLQTIAQNFVSGLILLVERPVNEGDFIKVGDLYGGIVRIGLRATQVVSIDEVTVVVPNSDLVSSQVTNLSAPAPRVRVSVSVGVEYGSDTDLVQRTLLEVAAANTDVLDTPEPMVRFDDFGSSALEFSLNIWINDPPHAQAIKSSVRFAIDAAFRANGIVVAFPQQDLHIRSGLEALQVDDRGPSGRAN